MKNKFKVIIFSIILILFTGCFRGVNSDEGKTIVSEYRNTKIKFINGDEDEEKYLYKMNSDYFKIDNFFKRKGIKIDNFIGNPQLFKNWLELNLTQKDIDELEKENDKVWYWFLEDENALTIKAETFKSKTKVVLRMENHISTMKRSNADDENSEAEYNREIKRIKKKKSNNEALTNGESRKLSNYEIRSNQAGYQRNPFDSSRRTASNMYQRSINKNYLNVITTDGRLKWDTNQFLRIAVLVDVLNKQVEYKKKITYYPSGRVMKLPDDGGPDGPLQLEDVSYIEKIKESLEEYKDEINKYKPDGDPQEVHFTFQYVNDMLVAEISNKNISASELNVLKKLKEELDSQLERLQEKEDWTTYRYKNGSVRSEGRRTKKGIRIDKWKYYYETGNLEAEGIYVENGNERAYDGDGYRVGTWKKYYETGELEALKTYKNTVVDVKEYYKNGKLKSIGSYSYYGNSVGEWKTYHENGNLSSIGKYKEQGHMSFRIGTWNYYDINGKLRYTETR